ncbi:unnamed protein product [Caenorhabditis angaria]|uniref:F-box domain-containing protein n=1 Tax=Caenorhabditis angaria TaxID=860376 RepID=A0A9P1MXK0_9PELO|nr:unnamed protein product [Caenorhabditis angaria]
MGSCLSTRKSDEIVWFELPFDVRRLLIDSMDFETKARFSQCSIDCLKEVSETRNFIDEIVIDGGGKGEHRNFCITVLSKTEDAWFFKIKKLEENCIVNWETKNNELISQITFENQDIIEILLKYFNGLVKKNTKSLKTIWIPMDDFPYNRTNINNLKCVNMKSLVLSENKYEKIDPILSGFVNIDTISRFHYHIEFPNLTLDDLFKLRSIKRTLSNPRFSVDEFDNFLRRILVEEESDEQIKRIVLSLKEIAIENHDILIRIVKKYTREARINFMEGHSEWQIVWAFVRRSKKWKHRHHRIILNEDCFDYSMMYSPSYL